MMKEFYLLSMRLSGIKSIENEIELNFYKKTIGNPFDPEHYNVKAIYGENGSGKTAIISAMDIVRNIILDDQYLSQKDNQVVLNEMINKKTKRFHFECEFLNSMKKTQEIYKYKINLSQNEKQYYVIDNETCSVRKANSKSNGRTLFDVYADEVQMLDMRGKVADELVNFTNNLHDFHSMVMKSSDYFFERKVMDKMNSLPLEEAMHILNFFSCILSIEIFFMNVHIYLDRQDKHQTYIYRNAINELSDINDESQRMKALTKIYSQVNDFWATNDRFIIKKEAFHYFEKYVRKLKKFISIFKSDLKNIEIVKRDEKDHYECELLFCYSDYSINYEFESAGIKRLVMLFNGLNVADEGGIVFIDELDLNINNIYLDRIIDYFVRYGRGQLIFTLHTTGAMNILRHNRKSIDFITDDGIVSWVSKGNASPENYYRNGMIDGIPFNIEPEDFLGIFGED